jgi:hypothetical protein
MPAFTLFEIIPSLLLKVVTHTHRSYFINDSLLALHTYSHNLYIVVACDVDNIYYFLICPTPLK